MTALVDILRQSGDKATIAEFTDVLRRHVRKEENFLFEEMSERFHASNWNKWANSSGTAEDSCGRKVKF